MENISLNICYQNSEELHGGRTGLTKHHRRSIRIPGYNYASEGWYFVTICVQDKRCLFGKIRDNKMILNNIGLIVEMEWKRTAQLSQNIILDTYIVMPNHIHGIYCCYSR